MWGGVAGGLAEYFDLDPTLMRIIWVGATIVTSGLAIPAYIVMLFIMPRDDDPRAGYIGSVAPGVPGPAPDPGTGFASTEGGDAASEPSAARTDAPPFPELSVPSNWRTPDRGRWRGKHIGGLVLIGLGVWFLAMQLGLLFWFDFRYVWPVVLIAVGVGLLARRGGWRP
jgi:phage shock protein PspC (stress-responsive transcriptional regulator)